MRKAYRKFLCRIGWHKEMFVSSYPLEVKLFKNLYEANGWNRHLTIKCFECKHCGHYWEETNH